MKVLEVRDLRKTFRSRRSRVEAVRGVSLGVEEGSILAFLGPNGAGKTTTIKMIAALVRPDAGSVRVLGRDPNTDCRALRDVGPVLEGNRNTYWRLAPEENIEYFGVLKGLRPRAARRRLLALVILPVEQWSGALGFVGMLLPVAPSAGQLRDLMARDLGLDPGFFVLTVLNAACHFLLGTVLFLWASRVARSRGLLGQY